MLSLGLALVLGVVLSFPLNVVELTREGKRANFLIQWVVMGIIFTVILWPIFYFGTPGLAGPFWGTTAFVTVALVVNVVLSGILVETVPVGVIAPIMFLGLAGLRGCAGCNFFAANEYYSLVGKVESRDWTTDLRPVSEEHIRMVPVEAAKWFGNKVLGESADAKGIGSRFHPGAYHIQRVRNKLVWVSPLEFNAFRHWYSSSVTPGYITVSAEDPREKPQLVTELKGEKLALKYMQESCFGTNLERYLWSSGYSTYQLSPSFEIDDEGRPFWVVTLSEPAKQYFSSRLKGVLTVDAQTGEIQRYSLDKLPEWVDIGMPGGIANEYLTYWGHLAKGWWNSVWTKDSIVEPTDNNVGLVYGADGDPYWFTGITSSSLRDDSLVGFVLVDARTGKAYEYKMAGSTEKGILEAVNKAVSNYSGWHGTEPVLYNLYGNLAWVCPVISTEGIFQKLAIVRADNTQVVLGGNKTEALREYRKLFAGSGNQISPTAVSHLQSATFRVDRREFDVKKGLYVFYTSAMPTRVFTAESEALQTEEVALTREGDTVSVKYNDTNEPAIPVVVFDNLTLGIASQPTAEK